MDDLTAALGGSLSVSSTINDPNAPHPRFSQYKQKLGPDQEERRRRVLQNQRDRRFDAQTHIRALYEDDWEGLPYGRRKDKDVEEMDTDGVVPKKPGRYYKDQLMLSEWMIEVPENFETDWTVVACPIGKRCLVIAGKGYSSAYSKGGLCIIESFQSLLPGGCRKYASKSDSTILDCIYSEDARTFFILDMMCWNDMEVYNSELEFRAFWLQAKVSEWPDDIGIFRRNNEFLFKALKFLPCDRETIGRLTTEHSAQELDGLLFYHKQVHYLFGPNPLCLWLQAYMLKDVLGIEVSREHMLRAPQNYQGIEEHINRVKEKKAKKEEKERRWREKKLQRILSGELPPSKAERERQYHEQELQKLAAQEQQQQALADMAAQVVAAPLPAPKKKKKKKKSAASEAMQTTEIATQTEETS